MGAVSLAWRLGHAVPRVQAIHWLHHACKSERAKVNQTLPNLTKAKRETMMTEELFSTEQIGSTTDGASTGDIDGEVLSKRDQQVTGAKPFFFDLETIPDFDRIKQFPIKQRDIPARCDLTNPTVFVNILALTVARIHDEIVKLAMNEASLNRVLMLEKRGKDRKSAIAAIEKAGRTLEADDQAPVRLNKTLATTPEYLKIIALGWAVGDEEPMTIVVGDGDFEESDLLEQFWALAAVHRPIVGYTIKHFDLPAIAVRSAILQTPGRFPIETSSWKPDVIDIFDRRYRGRMPGPTDCGKLKDMAKVYGIDVPAGDMDGSQVLETYDKDRELIHKYVQSDVEVTRSLYTLLLGSLF